MLAVYITMHGHLTPGGGFQGGVVAATALLLVYLGSDYDRMRRLRPRALVETGFGVLTALLGAVMALGQDHLKRLLAFVTISQIGLALIGVGLLTPAGIAGATLLIGADGLLRAGLFVCFGAVLHRCGSVYQSQLHGRGKLLPRAFGIFFVLGLAALPPRLGGLRRPRAPTRATRRSRRASSSARAVASPG